MILIEQPTSRAVWHAARKILTEADYLLVIEHIAVIDRGLNRIQHTSTHIVTVACRVDDPFDDHRRVVTGRHNHVNPRPTCHLSAQRLGDLLGVHAPES